MLGHKLGQVILPRLETFLTFRENSRILALEDLFDVNHCLGNVYVQDFDSVQDAFTTIKPTVVVNCIGLVKQLSPVQDAVDGIMINALFPHRLAELCKTTEARLITISTDCVFSGHKGNYRETDVPDAEDFYGRTKLLGEVDNDNCLTIRTSMIGRQLLKNYGLLEWFLKQAGNTIKGYSRVKFSGLTTKSLAEIILQIITEHQSLSGIYHLASDPISKFDLLDLIKKVYGIEVEILPDNAVFCDRSLNSERFYRATGIKVPAWSNMINQIHTDTNPYYSHPVLKPRMANVN